MLVFLILLFSFISLHCSLKKPFLSLLDLLWNSAFSWVYLSLSSLPFTSLVFFQLFLTNRFKELRSVRVPEELWTEVLNIIHVMSMLLSMSMVTRIIPKKRKCRKAKWLFEEAL